MAQRIIDRTYVGDILQHLYASDLDVSISLISKKGYFYLGSDDKRVPLHGTSIEEAVTDLATKLAHQYPASEFAAWWVTNFRDEKNN